MVLSGFLRVHLNLCLAYMNPERVPIVALDLSTCLKASSCLSTTVIVA